jgi:hypothetical protein
MASFYKFRNLHPVRSQPIVGATADTDVELLDDDFVTITYKGTDGSQWFTFENKNLADVVVGGVLGRSGGTTRFNDNEQAVAASSTLWVNDNLFAAPGTTWQDDVINFFDIRIDITEDTPATPNQRIYSIIGTGRQSSLARQPAAVFVSPYRII